MHSMDLAYAAADLIISRAGAMTCYEILATGKPSILVKKLHFSFPFLFFYLLKKKTLSMRSQVFLYILLI
jgi:hypothetical protein